MEAGLACPTEYMLALLEVRLKVAGAAATAGGGRPFGPLAIAAGCTETSVGEIEAGETKLFSALAEAFEVGDVSFIEAVETAQEASFDGAAGLSILTTVGSSPLAASEKGLDRDSGRSSSLTCGLCGTEYASSSLMPAG